MKQILLLVLFINLSLEAHGFSSIGRTFGFDALVFLIPSILTIVAGVIKIEPIAKKYEIALLIIGVIITIFFFWHSFIEIEKTFQFIGWAILPPIGFLVYMQILDIKYSNKDPFEVRRKKIEAIKKKKTRNNLKD